jgi:uncharacterized protein YigE (DUF2233 family)
MATESDSTEQPFALDSLPPATLVRLDSAQQTQVTALWDTLAQQQRHVDSLALLLHWATLTQAADSSSPGSHRLSEDSSAIKERPMMDTATIAPDTVVQLQQQLSDLRQAFDSLHRAYLASADQGQPAARYAFTDTIRQQRFITCVTDPGRNQILVLNRHGKKNREIWTFASVAAAIERDKQPRTLHFAMNAGMYQLNRHAQGLLISRGITQQPIDPDTAGYGNFYLQPNGIFALDTSDRAYVVTTQQYPLLADSVAIRYATQSGPMMLIDGQVNDKFGRNSPNRHIRNAVGVTPFGQVVFAISEQRVTFYELSTYLLRHGCVNALYLDGAISQAYLPALGLSDLQVGTRLGPIVVIIE